MKKLSIKFLAQNKYIALPLVVVLRKKMTKAMKRGNKKTTKAQAEVVRIEKVEEDHLGGFYVIITGEDVFVDKEEKKLEEALYKLLRQHKSDPNITKNPHIFQRLKQVTLEWSKRQIIKGYAILGILVEWESEVIQENGK